MKVLPSRFFFSGEKKEKTPRKYASNKMWFDMLAISKEP